MDYIYILNYETGECIIRPFPSNSEPEEWLCSNGYNMDSIHYMVGTDLLLDIKI